MLSRGQPRSCESAPSTAKSEAPLPVEDVDRRLRSARQRSRTVVRHPRGKGEVDPGAGVRRTRRG
jgi:hypothetical protein